MRITTLFKKLTIVFFLSIFICSCKDSGSPESISKLFLISLNKNDLETARNISTKNTRDILKIWEALSKNQFTEEQLKQREENFKVTIEKVIEQNDSTAVVKYVTQPAILPFDQFRLLKSIDKDGRERWKVDISTLDLVSGTDGNDTDTLNNDGQQIHPQPDSIATPE